MAKIKIEKMCEILKKDINEKGLFFKELNAPEFLVPFYNAGLFQLNDDASFWMLKYFKTICNNETESLIVKIINDNLKCLDINEIQASTYYQLTQLVDIFSNDIIINLNLKQLSQHNNSIELIKVLFKRECLISLKEIVKDSLNSLLRYSVEKTSFDKRSRLTYEIYNLNDLISNELTKENFKRALSHEFVFDFLLKKYHSIYKASHDKMNDILDVYSIQSYDMESLRKRLMNEYHVDNAEDIVLYFICINLNINNDAYTNIIKLLNSKIYMLKKLGLYFILRNNEKYIDSLKVFFDKINSKNIVRITEICLYELVKILEILSLNGNADNFNPYIEKFLNQFPESREKLKYDVLHGLKQHKKFSDNFYQLKEKYNYEKDKPGLYWQEGVGGWVTDVSPIDEKTFKLKNISEQIDYVNSDIDYTYALVQVDTDKVEEINERGLQDLFRKVISEDINKYLNDDNIFKLDKKAFIDVFIQVATQQVDKINSFNRIIDFIDIFFSELIQNSHLNENQNILSQLLEFNLAVSKKRHKDFHKVLKYIIAISCSDFNEQTYKADSDWGFYSLNTIHGRNFHCLFEHFRKIRKLNKKDNEFLLYIMQESNFNKFCSFYYYLGMNYYYYSQKFPEIKLLEKINILKDNAKKCFLNGYLSYFRTVESLKELKSIILESLGNGEIIEGRIRTRFVKMILMLRLDLNENSLYEEFSKYFSSNDFEEMLNYLIYREKINCSKENIIEFWVSLVNTNLINDTCLLLELFNKYCDFTDIKKYKTQLINILKKGFPKDIVLTTSIEHFLDKLLSYLKATQDSVFAYQILEQVVFSMKDVKYLYKEITLFTDLLETFIELDNSANAQLIASRMYEIPCLKFSMSNLKKFLPKN